MYFLLGSVRPGGRHWPAPCSGVETELAQISTKLAHDAPEAAQQAAGPDCARPSRLSRQCCWRRRASKPGQARTPRLRQLRTISARRSRKTPTDTRTLADFFWTGTIPASGRYVAAPGERSERRGCAGGARADSGHEGFAAEGRSYCRRACQLDPEDSARNSIWARWMTRRNVRPTR